MKPWSNVPINDNKEELISIPNFINTTKPHPYLKLGAPYKNKNKIWNLREGVVKRLIDADNYLRTKYSDYSLILYDTWRPVEVQAYMFNMAFEIECRKRGLRISNDSIKKYSDVIKTVEKFWAYPTFDASCPPPHSTGAALDISIIDRSGNLLDMGCDIDEMSSSANPNFYEDSNSEESMLRNSRRLILKDVMSRFGFAQHPNEWWHFSFGDQLWAWISKNNNAIYGKI